MHKKAGIIFSVIMIFILSGCSAIKSPENLMRRPKSYFNGEEINRVVSEFITHGKTLTLASGQKNRESIRKIDLDSDGNDELLLLYKKNIDEYGVIILKKKKDKWHEINRIEGGGKGIDLIEYGDITGDKKPELFIGWDSEEDYKNYLDVYSSHDGYFHFIHNTSYLELGIHDLDGDEKNELILLRKLPESNAKSLQVLKYYDREIISLDEFAINNLGYDSIMTFGNASSTQKGIFIDFYLEEHSAYTDLFILKDNKLIEVLGNEGGKENKTFQIKKVGSKDINNDGIIEIGLLKQLKKTEEIPVYDVPWIYCWYRWDGKNDLNLVKREYYNYDIGYKFDIPDQWGEKFTIVTSYDEENIENKIEFYSVDSEGDLGELFLSIVSFNKQQWQQNIQFLKNNNYIVLEENDKRTVVGIIHKNKKISKFLLDIDDLKQIFSLINLK